MANILSIEVIYDGTTIIENARRKCPVCGHINKKTSNNIRGNMYVTTYLEKCEDCNSEWNVTTDEQDS